jgi:hypothetical protein
MAAVGTLVGARTIVTTVCYVELSTCAKHNYHWRCTQHGDENTAQTALMLMGDALGHCRAHVNDDVN